MAHSYHEIAFTPRIRALQARAGSRDGYAAMGDQGQRGADLTAREAGFISSRDSFYMASVSESGWPYLQHRGGPVGFMKALDAHTLGFADYSGNRQYVSTGNLQHDERVSLFFMDYPNRRRLKLFGRVRIVDTSERDLLAQLQDADYPALVERGFLVTVEGFDWNCPAHITPRFTESELQVMAPRQTTVAAPVETASAVAAIHLGAGPLPLVITGMRQLTPRVRAYELRHPEGKPLPPAEPGSHLTIPVQLPGGTVTERHYSIASNPARTDAYEIAVQREDKGSGGSLAVHNAFALGMVLHVDPPANHFPLHTDTRPTLLIAGGIGITPMKSMAQALQVRGAPFHLHYAGRSRPDMAYRDRLERQLAEQVTVYSKADGERLDLLATLQAASADTMVYVCGPQRLVAGVLDAARSAGLPTGQVRVELFG